MRHEGRKVRFRVVNVVVWVRVAVVVPTGMVAVAVMVCVAVLCSTAVRVSVTLVVAEVVFLYFVEINVVVNVSGTEILVVEVRD
jgi:hypothetical protein